MNSSHMHSSRVISSSVISSKGRILLVDDEPLVLEIIDSALKKEGYEVVCAPNSHVALHQLDRTHFDGIVCDVRLENLDGFDLLAISKKKNPVIAGILITGAPCEEDACKARILNCCYLSKPIGISQLIGTIDDSISQARYEIDNLAQI